MALLAVNNLAKAFGVDQIFAGISFQLQSGEKAGLVGINGTGKSTLLRAIIAATGARDAASVGATVASRATGDDDEYLADTGEISLQRGATLAYLCQSPDFEAGTTLMGAMRAAVAELLSMRERLVELSTAMSRPEVHDVPECLVEHMERYTRLNEEFEARQGYQVESRVRGVLAGLGFTAEQFEQPLATMSGGERTRAELARILLRQPDLLLLDEPTNHLDVRATEWLEGFLVDYPGAALIVSHDRYFLDRVVTRVLALSHGRLKAYPGNYSAFQQQRDLEVLSQTRAYERQQEVIAREEEFIRSAKATEKAKKTAASREKRLAMLERVEPPQWDKEVHINFGMLHRSGNRVLAADGLFKRFEDREVLSGVDFTISYRDRVGLVGPNGAGKTTLLRMIVGLERPDAGSLRHGAGVTVGYFDQLHQGLDDSRSAFEEIIATRHMTSVEARNLLGRYLFSGEDVFRPISELSGGERSRVALAKISLTRANFLILDEPTNHLDLSSIEALEAALVDFPGTLVIVSHDRYFVAKVCNRIFELDGGRLAAYDGDYQAYLEAKRAGAAGAVQAGGAQRRVEESPGGGPDNGVVVSATKPLSKHQAALRAQRASALEDQVHAAEKRVGEIEARLADPGLYSDFEAARQLSEEYQEAKAALEEILAQWLEAAGG